MVPRGITGLLELSRVSLVLFAFAAINLVVLFIDTLAPVDISIEYRDGAFETVIRGSPSSLSLEIALSITSAAGFAIAVASYFPIALEVLMHELGAETVFFRRLCIAAVISYLVSIASGIAGYILLATHLHELAEVGIVTLGLFDTVIGGFVPITVGLLGDLFMALIFASMRRIFGENTLLLAAFLLILTNLYPNAYPLAWLVVFFSLRHTLRRVHSRPQ